MLPLPTRWAIRIDPAADGVTNMATDAALLAHVRTGVAVWRWYTWSAPTVSFGRNERVAGRFDAESLAAAGLAAVRRPTGGRALLHHREFTYSVTCPLPPAIPWRAAYDAVNGLLLATLRRAGVPADLSTGAATALRPEGPVCFDAPAPGEIVVGAQKLVGSAVWRVGHAYLQHGSILRADEQHRLVEASRGTVASAPPAATLDELAPHLTLALLNDVLRTVLADAGAQVVADIADAADTVALNDECGTQHRHFAGTAWLWRR